MRAEDLLPEALQKGPDLSSEVLRREGLLRSAEGLCACGLCAEGMCTGGLCAEGMCACGLLRPGHLLRGEDLLPERALPSSSARSDLPSQVLLPVGL